MADKTNYAQSLMHMIKGNLGTGILAMPASFAHTGLVNALIGLPILCIISTYCVHLLVKSSQQLESKTKGLRLQYASLAKHSFKSGPKWMRNSSSFMCNLVDGILLIAQIGVCCVYIVFVVDNVTSILGSYKIKVAKSMVFIMVFPITLFLSYIRTLKRLAIASACANFLQAIGISLILEYLLRDIDKVNLAERDNFRPLSEAALGFGSAMFAFEGISVVLPVYTRMKNSDRMSGTWGVVNVSYVVLLILYFIMGLFGFLKFGHNARDSITLNLPPEPLYDVVRGIFLVSVLLTYPLQFYVPNEIIWNWFRKNFLLFEAEAEISVVRALEVVMPPTLKHPEKPIQINGTNTTTSDNKIPTNTLVVNGEKKLPPPTSIPKVSNPAKSVQAEEQETKRLLRYEYCCRTIIVIITFILAISVPKLNLLMDLIGSISGTALSLILPAIIHIAAFWDDSEGFDKFMMIFVDSIIIIFGLVAGTSGSIFSMASIIDSFHH